VTLPFTATEEGVRALFAVHGSVEKVSLITDRDTGRPRGFGFVEMSNADASRAMQALNGKDFEGRALKVNEAQDRDRSGGGNRGGCWQRLCSIRSPSIRNYPNEFADGRQVKSTSIGIKDSTGR